MSWTAMWGNKNVHSCSTTECVCGTRRGYGIPPDLVEYQTLRIIIDIGTYEVFGVEYPRTKCSRTPEYGRLMTQGQADELDRVTGRSEPYGRNVVQFVMSRAARKRGVKSTNYNYNRVVERYAARLACEQVNTRHRLEAALHAARL